MKRLLSLLAVLCLAVSAFGAANITLSSITVGSNGKTITATLGGGTGSGFGITNGNGIVIYTNNTVQRMLTAQSVSGTTLTITLGFPVGSSNTVTLSTNNGATSTIFDGGGNTVQTYTNTAVTNNSTVTVTGFNSGQVSGSAFKLFGGFTKTTSGGRELYNPQPADSGFIVNFTGTDVAMVCQSNSAFAVSLDGAASSNVTPSVGNAIVAFPLATSLTDASHSIKVTNGLFWDTGSGVTTNGTLLVAGASPAVAAPSGSWGTNYWFGPNTTNPYPNDSTIFTSYGDMTMGPSLTTSSTTGGRTFKETQGAQSIRFSIASDVTMIAVFGAVNASAGRTYVVMIDGVQASSTAWPTTGASYQRVLLASGLSTGSVRDVRILCITPLAYKTSGVWYDAYVELDGSGIAAVAHTAASIGAGYGDSIMGATAASPAVTDAREHFMYLAAEANGGNAAINGIGGGAVVNTGRDNTSVIPTNATYLVNEYGTNDLTDLGTGGGQTTFQTAYGVMIDNERTQIGGGKRILCLQPFPRNDSGTLNGRRALCLTLMQAAISGKSDVYAINTDNWWDPTNGTLTGDGLHPNAAGYAILANRLKPILATYAISLTPYNGIAGSSYTVTLAAGATFTGDQTVTLSDGAAGGTFTPSVGSPGTSSITVTPTNGATSFTFTYSPASSGTKTITPTSAQDSWAMPPAVTFNGTVIAERRTNQGLIISARR